jgi:PAS domain S-box-containing protein
MELSHFINNMAILMVLTLPYRYFLRRQGCKSVQGKILAGLLFGAAAIAGMMNPVNFAPGIVFDGRSVVASVGALFCGPISAIVIVVTAGLYRVWMNGTGTVTGVLVLTASAGLGVAYHYIYRLRPRARSPRFLFAFGVLVHVVMMGLMLTLPSPHSWDVLAQMSVPILLVFPLGTVLLGQFLANEEARIDSDQAVCEANRRLRLAAKASNIGLWDWDLRNNSVFFSPEWKGQLGYADDEIPGRYEEWESRLHPEDRDRAVATVRKYLENPSPDYENEFRLQHRDGSYRSILTRAEAILDDAGRPYRMLGCHIDLTDHKRTERELRESESEYRNLVEGVNSVIMRMDTQGRILFMNKFGQEFFGYTQEELLGKSVLGTIVPETDTGGRDLALMAADVLQYPEQHQNNENENMRKNGERVRLAWTNRAIRDADGNFVEICCVGNDVTAHRRAEAKLAQLATAMEQAAEAIIVTDTDGNITYVNSAFESIAGYTREEALGRNPRFLKSGKQDSKFYEELWGTLLSGQTWQGHFVNIKKDGTLYEEDATVSPVVNEKGQTVNYVAVKRDVTEKALLERRLRQAQKLEAIGALAGGIAHDFNNVLAAIIGYGEIALDEAPEGTSLREDLDHVLVAAARAKELVRQILTFSRDGERERRALHPALIVKEALKLLRPSLPITIEIEENVASNPGMVLADATELHQVVMNLCTNAYHAMREAGGRLTIAVDPFLVTEDYAQTNPELETGQHVRLTVSDTGCGMDQETLDRIFDPFFTTKPEGEGTGLGLATVHGIISSCGGSISVYSEPGQGTTFHVYLPCLEETAPAQPDEESTPPDGYERVLVVDDEEDLVRFTVTSLRSLGYDAEGLTDSEEALRRMRAEPNAFDLLLTDHTMTRLTGLELAAEVLRIRHDLPVVMRCGVVDKTVFEKARAVGVYDVLEKPAGRRRIASTIRQALDTHGRDSSGPAGEGQHLPSNRGETCHE